MAGNPRHPPSPPDASGRPAWAAELGKLAAVLLLAGAYAWFFPDLHANLGEFTRGLTLVYVALIAWLWGVPGAVAGAVINLLLNRWLYTRAGIPFTSGVLGLGIMLLMGGSIGWLSQVRRRLKRELAARAKAETELAEYRHHLEQMVQERTADLRHEAAARWEAEEALIENERKYRSLFESSGAVILLIKDAVIDCNPAAAQALKMDRQQIIGRRPTELIYAEPDGGETGSEIEERLTAAQRGEPQLVNWSLSAGDGSRLELELQIKDVALGGDRVIMATGRDVTQSRGMEQELDRERERFRVLADQSPVGIILLGPQLDLEYMNPAVKQMMGVTDPGPQTAETLARHAYPDPVYRQQVMDALTNDIPAARQGKSQSRTFQVTLPDGENREIRFRLAWVTGERYLLIGEDETERLRAERGLQESEQRYRHLVENLPVGLFLADEQGRLFYINNSLRKLFGYTQDDFGLRSVWEVVAPEEHDILRRRLAQRLDGEEPDKSSQVYTCLTKSGQVLNCEVSAIMTTQQGRPVVQGILRDVTQQFNLERQLRHAQKMEAVGNLSSGIAHDFNNILQALGGYLQLMQGRPGQDEENLKFLAEMSRSVDRATDLVRRLLTFSRRVESRLAPLDLNREVEQAMGMLERTLPKMIAVETRLDPALPAINADATQVEQVLLNLASNAADAMPQGGRLLIQTEQVNLDQEYCRTNLEAKPGDWVRLSVSDSGEGMEPDTLKDIFDPFFTTKDVGKGTGLGLSMVYGIVKSHRGFLSVYSHPGQGTTFRMYFPPSDQAAAPAPAPTVAAQPPAGRGELVLVVDDEADVVDIASTMLTNHGYRVLTAASGEEALAVFQMSEPRPKLVILDLGMPGMGGAKALEELKAMDSPPKVIIASGYAGGDQAERAVRAGSDGFMAKPYRLADMLQKVREVLGEGG